MQLKTFVTRPVIVATLLVLLNPFAGAATFYLSPSGADTNPGTEDEPFATLEHARNVARQVNEATIVLTPGTYRLTQTFALDERDSNTTYRGIDARVTGSVAIPADEVKPVSDPAIVKRLCPEVRGRVLEIDLHVFGITDFGEIGPRGFRRPYVSAPLELFVDDVPLTLAQWPNPGEPGEPMGRVLDEGSVTRNGEKPIRGGVFKFKTRRPARWTQAGDVWITGLFRNGYADNTVKVKSFDLKKRTLTTVEPHMYGFRSGKPWNRWVALNILVEIDLPGEFMADQETGKLYFLPPSGKAIAECTLEVSVMNDPLIAIEGARDVVFSGVDIECSRGMGVYIEGGANNRIQNATLRNLGMVAVSIGKGIAPDQDYQHSFTGQPISRALGSWHEHLYDNPTFNREAGTGHGVVNCEIYNIGAGAISLGGGDRVTLFASGNFVDNCEIHNFNRWDRTYKAAVNIDGVGNLVRHNLIYDCPGSAIYLHGNEHIIEYNEIHHAMMSGDDMGALYMGRDPTERGNIIRFNYWHDLALEHRTSALYFDDSGGDGSLVYGNVFRRAGTRMGTLFLTGGSDFTVENNVFIDCVLPIRTEGFRSRVLPIFKERLVAVGYDSPEWIGKYPEFQNYLKQERPFNNRIGSNLIVKSDDPRFVDGAQGNFALKPDANIGIPGFQPIPFDKIGRKEIP